MKDSEPVSLRLSDRTFRSTETTNQVVESPSERRRKIIIYVVFMIFIFITISIGTALSIELIIYSDGQASSFLNHLKQMGEFPII